MAAADHGLLAIDESITTCKLLPWPVAFSVGRAVQEPALSIWGGQYANARRAQQALLRRAENNQAARRGECTAAPSPTCDTQPAPTCDIQPAPTLSEQTDTA